MLLLCFIAEGRSRNRGANLIRAIGCLQTDMPESGLRVKSLMSVDFCH